MDNSNIDLAALSEKLKQAYPDAPPPPAEPDLADLMQKLKATQAPAAPAPMAAAPAPAAMPEEPEEAPLPPPTEHKAPAQLYPKGLSDQDIVAAQAQQSRGQLIANLGQAADQINAGFSKGAFTPSPEFYQNLAKQAGQPLENIAQRRAAADQDLQHRFKQMAMASEEEKGDPNSQISRIGQTVVKGLSDKLGIDVGDTSKLSYAKAQALFGAAPLEKMAGMLAAQDYKKALLGIQEQKIGNLQDERRDKRFERFGKEITNAANNPAAKQAIQNVYSVDKLEGLFKQFPDLNSMPPQQVREVGSAFASLLQTGGGRVALEQINHLVPSSMTGDWKKIQSYMQNLPMGAQQGAFLKLLRDSTVREKQVAQNTILKTQLGTVSNFAQLEKESPEQFKQVLEEKGIPYDTYANFKKTKKLPGEGAALTPAQEAGLTSFMAAHPELDKDKAIDILKKAGRL